MKRVLLMVAMGVACGGDSQKPDKKDRATAALKRAEMMQPRLAKLRGLPFKGPVPTAQQASADFKAFLHREIEKELPKDKSAQQSAAYFHIGLLDKKVDLATAAVETVGSQAVAYYDPRAKKFYLVMVPDDDAALDTTSAHELTHALQDQAFDLVKYQTQEGLDDDAQMARKFVIEGDASLAMAIYMAAEASGGFDAAPLVPMLRPHLEKAAESDLAGYIENSKQQAKAFKDPEFRRSMEAIGELPPMMVWPMLDSYMKGALVALVAYEHGGWKAVDELFKTPPESTEQVLHPATKLIPNREKPIRVKVPALDGEVLLENVLGELQWRTYFSLWEPSATTKASEGWGGDRFVVVKRTDGSLLALHATIWDSPADATEFAEAYEASFKKRGSRKHVLVKDGVKVFILDGSDDAALLSRLVAETTFSN